MDTKETPGVSSSGRSEERTVTQENVSVKKRVMMKSPKRPATHVSPPDDPVKRRLLKKTDLKSDDVLMPVEIEDTDLLCCKNGEHTAKTWSEEVQKTKILSVFDDHEEMMKGRTTEGAELTERNGCHDSCDTIRGGWQTSDSNTMGRSRERRSREVQAGS